MEMRNLHKREREMESYAGLPTTKTTNLASLSICLGFRTWEIAVQVRDRNLYTTSQQNDGEV